MKIQAQLTRLVLASLLPAMLAAGLLITFLYDRQRADIEDSTLETVKALVRVVDGDLARGRAALQALATSPYLTSGDLAAFHRQATEALPDLAGNNVVLSDASGRQLLNTLRPFGTPLPLHANQAELRRVFETGQSSISGLYVGAVSQRPLISIDVPVRRGGRVIYDISMGFFPERLAEVLERQKLPAEWGGAIFDGKGTVVARTRAPERYVGRPGAPGLMPLLAQQKEGYVETETLEGIPSVIVFSRSDVSNWSVAIAIPRSVFAHELRRSMYWAIAGTAVLLASGIALAQLLSVRIARAIRGLIPPAKALGRGERVVVPALELEEADEVGRALVSASKILRDREEILAIVSHDLRNPLATLIFSAGVAELKAAKLPDGDAVRGQLATIVEAGRRMSGMVDDLLAVAVSNRGEASMLKMAPVDCGALIARAADAVRPLFEREGIELRLDISQTLPQVEVDSDRILRVFVNLLDNALKFTRPPGLVVLSASETDGDVRFCVANTGPALAADQIERMFQPFWQARPDDRRGVGLGLSICRSIVETHGGRVWAEAASGMRVRVCFELPRAEGDETKPALTDNASR